MKKELLIIHKTQFGYLTDVYKWCEYLKDEYAITVVSLNQSFPTVEMDGVKVVDVTGDNYYWRGLKFLLACITQILRHKGIIIALYFRELSLLKPLLKGKKTVYDVRTLSISDNDVEKEKYNNHVKSVMSGFSCATAISKGVKDVIDDGMTPINVLPLGADFRGPGNDRSKDPHLLYVGTLWKRRIEDTINGLKLFVDKNPSVQLHYDIVGDGKEGELDKLKRLVEELGLQEHVTFHGRIPNNEIGPFLDKANVGVSYVPITDYYQHQPPTKTFEYVLSGMYCLATATYSNQEVINDENGCLIQDTPEAFADGIEMCITKLEGYNPEKIKHTLKEYSWQSIVDDKLKPILIQVESGR